MVAEYIEYIIIYGIMDTFLHFPSGKQFFLHFSKFESDFSYHNYITNIYFIFLSLLNPIYINIVFIIYWQSSVYLFKTIDIDPAITSIITFNLNFALTLKRHLWFICKLRLFCPCGNAAAHSCSHSNGNLMPMYLSITQLIHR